MEASADYYIALADDFNSGGNLEAEIVWKMLQTRLRSFKVKKRQVGELKKHVQSRINAIQAIPLVRWKFGAESGYNSKYWSDAVGTVKTDAAGGLNDMFLNPAFYTRGCKFTSRMILLKGVLDTIGAGAFNKAIGTGGFIDERALSANLLMANDQNYQDFNGLNPVDWVPGDSGYVQGHNINRDLAGEWLVYKGFSEWWGFGFNDPDIGWSLQTWIRKVQSWSTDPNFKACAKGQRIYSGVGLEKK